jgi:hypothetical protein
VSSPATLIISQAGGNLYKPKSIPLPAVKKDQQMTIPITMTPAFLPDAYEKVYPFGGPFEKCASLKPVSNNPGALPPQPGSEQEAKEKSAQKAYADCQQKALAEYNAKMALAEDLFKKWIAQYTKGAVTFRVDVKNSGGQEWAMDKVMCATPLGSCQVPKM